MRNVLIRTSMIATLTVMTASAASAQTAVTLPNSTQTTTLTANVSEQAQVTVPAGVTFNVTNVGASTAASAASVTVNSIVLATATKTLKISLQGNAAAFTPSVALAATWAVGDVTWSAATFSNGTGAAGTLIDTAYTAVADCAADAASCSTTNLVFTLAAKSTVKRSGNHTLAMTWKFESIGT
ncbi:MAG: hypothetical protein WD690_08320 [Vicinamibacterales bacterium]